MKSEEVLVVEHREIVELYQHYSTNIAYCFISYLILNGVLGSFLGTLLSVNQPTYALRILVLLAPPIGIIGNIVFLVSLKKLFNLILFLANRGARIEEILQERKLELGTFKQCVAYALKLPLLQDMYIIAMLLVVLWATAFGIVILFG